MINAYFELVNTFDVAHALTQPTSAPPIRKVTVNALVDCNELFTIINPKICRELELLHNTRRHYKLYNGIEGCFDFVHGLEIRYKHVRTMLPAVVVPNIQRPIIGWQALACLGVLINPAGSNLVFHPEHPNGMPQRIRIAGYAKN